MAKDIQEMKQLIIHTNTESQSGAIERLWEPLTQSATTNEGRLISTFVFSPLLTCLEFYQEV
jgi:hypothetical protein